MTTQNNTIKTFNYIRNPRGAVLYTRILAQLFDAARFDVKPSISKNDQDLLDEWYKAMAGIGEYHGVPSRERVEYMLAKHGEITSGAVEDAFKDSNYSYEWFVEQHNRAVDMAKSFDREHIDYVF